MSDTILKIIPATASFFPDEPNQRATRDMLHAAFPGSEIESSVTAEIEFVDPGENFETVSCNLCGQPLELEDWQEAMDAAYATRFENLNFITPCCSSITSLNVLNYQWPAGFAKFQLTVRNPQSDLSEQLVEDLQRLLGTPLRVIWAHY